jgi:hypothetical protein
MGKFWGKPWLAPLEVHVCKENSRVGKAGGNETHSVFAEHKTHPQLENLASLHLQRHVSVSYLHNSFFCF